MAKPSHSSLTTLRVKDFETTWQALWWLGEFALAFLFEPLDWLITFRDIASGIYHGDLSAWDFLGFLPIITNNLGRIARLMSRSDVDELVDFIHRADVFADGASQPGRPRGMRFNDADSYGPYPGYRTSQIRGLQERANKAGFTLSIDNNAEEFLDSKRWNAAISRNPDNTVTIHLRSDATTFEWFHERIHALQLFELGNEEFSRLGTWKRELHVYNEIIQHASRNNPAGSPIFNRAELQGAWGTLEVYWRKTRSYLGGIDMPTNPFPLNSPANIRYEAGEFIRYD